MTAAMAVTTTAKMRAITAMARLAVTRAISPSLSSMVGVRDTVGVSEGMVRVGRTVPVCEGRGSGNGDECEDV